MLFKRSDPEGEVVLLEELLDVLGVTTVGRAVDKLTEQGVVFAADARGRVGVLAPVADELRGRQGRT